MLPISFVELCRLNESLKNDLNLRILFNYDLYLDFIKLPQTIVSNDDIYFQAFSKLDTNSSVDTNRAIAENLMKRTKLGFAKSSNVESWRFILEETPSNKFVIHIVFKFIGAIVLQKETE